MAIALDNLVSDSGLSSLATLLHTCVGSDRVIVASVNFIPSPGAEVTSVVSNIVQPFSLVDVCQIENIVRTETWVLFNPTLGLNTIKVSFNDSIDFMCVTASYTGVAGTIYNFRSGAGKNVTDFGIKSFAKTNGIAIGMGCTSNPDSYVQSTVDSQNQDWNVTSSKLRCQSISATRNFDNDRISVRNSLTQATDYAMVIMGMDGI